MEWNRILNEDCVTGMGRLDGESVDCVLADPPYLYLKGAKLDRPFDEAAFFREARLLRLVTDAGGTVVDPFCGIGSACMACMDTGRKFLGFEIDPEYWAAAVRRVEAHVPELWSE